MTYNLIFMTYGTLLTEHLLYFSFIYSFIHSHSLLVIYVFSLFHHYLFLYTSICGTLPFPVGSFSVYKLTLSSVMFCY
jgi:hypothetical protein